MVSQDVKFRIERDTMGEVQVPADAYYGAQTQRAADNFPVSGIRFPRIFVKALGLIKKYAAQVNAELGLLDPKIARAVMAVADEVATGRLDEQFVVDVFQTGSGTSTNMNVNEVIAAKANELITGKRDAKKPIHPNDHVNMGQSSNDVIPTAIHIASLTAIAEDLIPALQILCESLRRKSEAFDSIVKIGRTHLQDAVPIRLGQEFSGYAHQVKLCIRRVQTVRESLSELALGGTAVGTGLNTEREFASRVIDLISQETGCQFTEAENHFEAQAAQDAAVETSGALKTVAVSLLKIANDIRWLSSGPRCGLGEINIPALQPGSSIMPGKVNPVIPESVIQVAAQVIGNDMAITIGGQGGNFDLNVMLPLIAHNLLLSIKILGSAARIFAQKCINGITANEARCRELIENSLAMSTALTPIIGYEKAAAIAGKAYAAGKTVREVAMEDRILPGEQLRDLLDPVKMT
ncbi:MAG: aspartate ammonia-lyase [Desulfobacterales bacterium C00003060]|nr:MAG: aspartate ammonia-lyase [Desulfobacterales bacterium C00003060]OEU82303.1 MAG: aspartate ammonia-lyase [Desulfobacterales bacterium S5133MH4]